MPINYVAICDNCLDEAQHWGRETSRDRIRIDLKRMGWDYKYRGTVYCPKCREIEESKSA